MSRGNVRGGGDTHHFPSLLDHVPGLQEVLAGHGDVLVVLAVIVIVVIAVLQVPRVLMTPATCAQSGAPGGRKRRVRRGTDQRSAAGYHVSNN